MTGHYELAEPREQRHECRLPGELRRWLHRVREGRAWVCYCGRRWRWLGALGTAFQPEWVPLDPPMDEMPDAVLGPRMPR